MALVKIFIGKEERKTANDEPPRRRHRQSRAIAATLTVLFFLIVATTAWKLFIWQSPTANPFGPALTSKVGLTLYYPTRLPAGFHNNTKSITQPQTNTVVFTVDGPNNQKIYVSQEKRPATFDLGGFYKQFTALHTVVTPSGEIAVGHVAKSPHTLIGSIAFTDTNTWVIADTNASLSETQLVEFLKSLVRA